MNQLRWEVIEMAEVEDRRRRRMEARRARMNARDPFVYMSENHFIKTFRLTKSTARDVIDLVMPHMPPEKRNDALTINMKVLIALAFYASGSYQTIVGQANFQVSQPTVSNALRQVTKALNKRQVFRRHVQFPLDRASRNIIKQGFYRKYKIPGIVGAIDGTHVRLIRPSIQEEQYFNRKGYHSLNVMIVCDSDLKILCIDPSHPGSTHDNRVWRTNPLCHYLTQKYDEERLSLLGDSGYALRKTIMTPPSNFQPDTPEAYFYDLHLTARNTVERCIGLLKARFRCLLSARMLHYDPVFSGQIVNACAVLHNMALRAQAPPPRLTREQVRHEAAYQVRRLAIERELLAGNARRVNAELMEGRAAQQSLIQRVWEEHQQNP